jgi:ketosteroid isomerase-like protein
MSEENVEIVRDVFDAFEAGLESGGTAEAFDLGSNFAADAEWIPVPEVPGPTNYRGREGFIEFMRTWTEDWEGWSLRLERLIDAGDDRVVALVHQRATGKGSGVPVEAHSGMVFEFEDGRVIRMRNYLHAAQALEAAGLSE